MGQKSRCPMLKEAAEPLKGCQVLKILNGLVCRQLYASVESCFITLKNLGIAVLGIIGLLGILWRWV